MNGDFIEAPRNWKGKDIKDIIFDAIESALISSYKNFGSGKMY